MDKINFFYACQEGGVPISIVFLNGGNVALNPQFTLVSELILSDDLDKYTFKVLADKEPIFDSQPFPEQRKIIDTGQGNLYGIALGIPINTPVVTSKTSTTFSFVLLKDDVPTTAAETTLFFN